MQITEEIRNEITLSLPSLGLDEVNRIAKECGCSIDTVYREWRKIKKTEDGPSFLENPVVMALVKLAVKRKRKNKKAIEGAAKIIKQLSAA
jgi:hypothetical protein